MNRRRLWFYAVTDVLLAVGAAWFAVRFAFGVVANNGITFIHLLDLLTALVCLFVITLPPTLPQTLSRWRAGDRR